MILSEKEKETIDLLENLKKQVNLLDSHKTVGLITDKQYAESLEQIIKKVEKIEEELGIEPPKEYLAFDLLFGDSMSKYNEMMESFEAMFK